MIKTLIIEDEPKNASLLSKMLHQHFEEIDIRAICDSKETSIQFLTSNRVDLIFMDIMLKDGNSFDLFEEIDLGKSQIIFLTAYDQFAIKAIKLSALDYLLKPINLDDLIVAVNKAIQNIHSKENHTHQLNVFNLNREKITKVVLPSSDGHTFLNLNDIYYIQSEGSYTTFHMKDTCKHMVSRHIKEYEELLENDGFFRIHQSYIINLLYVKKYIKGSGGTVIMDNGKEIDVAVRRKEEFLKKTHIH